jgi:hypothetical protein
VSGATNDGGLDPRDIPITLTPTVIEIREAEGWVEVIVDGRALYVGERITTMALEEILLRLDPLFSVERTYEGG